MKFKPGTRIAGIQPELVLAAVVIDRLFHTNGLPELVITSGVDGKHSKNSLHYVGRAWDIRSWYIDDKETFAQKLRESLTEEFDVVVEKTHVHVEFDPK